MKHCHDIVKRACAAAGSALYAMSADVTQQPTCNVGCDLFWIVQAMQTCVISNCTSSDLGIELLCNVGCKVYCSTSTELRSKNCRRMGQAMWAVSCTQHTQSGLGRNNAMQLLHGGL
jgi:hypothetical protein